MLDFGDINLKVLVKNSCLQVFKCYNTSRINVFFFLDLFHVHCQMNLCKGGENVGRRAKNRKFIICRELIRTRSKWYVLAAFHLECHTLLKNNIQLQICVPSARRYYLACLLEDRFYAILKDSVCEKLIQLINAHRNCWKIKDIWHL